MSLTKVTHSMISGSVVDVVNFGADPTGVADSTAAITAALASQTENFTLYFPPGKFLFTEVVISDKINLTVTGPGVLNGQITVRNVAVVRGELSNLTLDGLTFNRGRTEVGKYAIALTQVWGMTIVGCTFIGVEMCVIVTGTTSVQQVASVYITACKTGKPDSSLYTAAEINNPPYVYENTSFPHLLFHNAMGQFHCGDINIRNNHYVFCSICQVYCTATDGIYITDNVFQLQSYSYESAIKTNNIAIDGASWVDISDNIFYEAGYEAIYLNEVSDVKVIGNFIGWPGQRQRSVGEGIYISPQPLGGDQWTTAIISNNVIRQPGGDGVKVVGNVLYLNCSNNVVITPADSAYYYGPVDATTYYGIRAEADGWGNVYEGNTIYLGDNLIPKSTSTVFGSSEIAGPLVLNNFVIAGDDTFSNRLTIGSITSNTIDIQGYKAVLVNTLGGTIHTINGGNNGQILLVKVSSVTITLTTAGNLKLGQLASLNVLPGSMATFINTGDGWWLTGLPV